MLVNSRKKFRVIHSPSYPCSVKNHLCDCPGTCGCPRPCYCERTCSSPCSCPNPCSCPIKRWLDSKEDKQRNLINNKDNFLKCRKEEEGYLCLTKNGKFIYIGKKSYNINRPIFARWDITYKCNLNCIHCYSEAGTLKSLGLKTEAVMDIIDFLDEIGILAIQFLGGEPFIRRDFLQILDYTVKKRIGIYINTNGTLISDKIISFLKDIEENLMAIQVGLEGPDFYYSFFRRSDLYWRVIENLKKLRRIHTTLSIVTTLTSINIYYLENFIKDVIKLGIKHLQILTIAPAGRACLNYKQFLLSKEDIEYANNIIEKYKDRILIDAVGLGKPLMDEIITKENSKNSIISYGCEAGDMAISIDPYGKVSLCALLGKDSYTLNILDYKQMPSRFLQDLKKNKKKLLPVKCLTCSFYTEKKCLGDCLVYQKFKGLNF